MQIRLCKIKEIPELWEFIHNSYKKDHILSRNRDLFDWQYVKENKVNFIIAKYRNKIKGMLGFIPYDFFNSSRNKFAYYWLSMWRSIEDGLGMSLLNYFTEKYNPEMVGGGHLSDIAMNIYRLKGYKVDYLDIYYMVNQDKKKFELIDNFDGSYISENRIDNNNKEFNFKDNSNILSYELGRAKVGQHKSLMYIEDRYVKHPVYDYKYIVVCNSGVPKTIIVYRIVLKCMFIVDFFGYINNFSGLGYGFQIFMQENDLEYVVFMNYGWDKKIIESSGFRKRESNSKVVIPTLFEPFKKKNIDHSFCYKFRDVPIDKKLIFHKGASDFDRPNE